MKIHNAVVCDLVRREDNGKHILIGVYPHDILVADFPAAISPVLWVQLYVDESGSEYNIEVRVTADGTVLTHGGGMLTVKNHLAPATFAWPKAEIKVDNECTLYFQIREKNKRWKTAKEIQVKLKPTTE